MYRRHRLLALASIALLFACVEDVEVPEELDSALTPRSSQLPPSTFLNQEAWAVAIVNGECPAQLNGHWHRVGTRMFRDGTQALALTPGGELPPLLRRFCLYRWPLAMGEPAAPDHEQLIVVSQEAPVVVTQTSPLLYMKNAAFEQAGGLGPLGVLGEHPVMVAVVDSGSSVGNVDPRDHGGAMSGLARGLACDGRPDCEASVRRTLALPIEPDGSVDDPNGGVYGTRAHVAIGIVEAVNTWRQAVLAGDPDLAPRLVINLSLGWVAEDVGECGASQASPWCGTSTVLPFRQFVLGEAGPASYAGRVGVEALHAALLYASCQGALIIAAAGNGRGDSCNEEPMAPAVWSKYRAPTYAECSGLGFLPNVDIGFGPAVEAPEHAAPLVLSVAAVDHQDQPIAATRPGTLTPLVAPGYHAIGRPSTTPLTGTSVSAAMVSGAAALVWSHKRELSPREVVDALWHFGRTLPLVPEAQRYGAAPTQVRRLDACRASAWAAGLDVELQCGTDDLEHILANLSAATFASVPPVLTKGPILSGPHSGVVYDDSCSACGEPMAALLEPTPDPEGPYFLACTDEIDIDFSFDATDDLAGPQPSTPICPDCPVLITTKRTTAALTLHRDYQVTAPLDITDGTLTIIENGNRTMYDLESFVSLDALRLGSTVSVNLPHHPNATGAIVNFAIVEDSGDTYYRSSQLRLTR